VPGLVPGRLGKASSRTPSMYADEKSDEAIVPRKRPNKGRQLPAEVVEGRASPKGNSRQAAVVRTLSRDTTSIRLAAVRRTADGFQPPATDVRPEGGARCVSSARRDLCGGRGAILVPTATIRPDQHLEPARSFLGGLLRHRRLRTVRWAQPRRGDAPFARGHPTTRQRSPEPLSL
jgi:hypothetical protein